MTIFLRALLFLGSAALLASCTSLPQPQPQLQPAPAPSRRPQITLSGNSDECVGVGIDIGGTDAPAKPPVVRKTGSVEFRGFTPAALDDFRIVPEEGLTLSRATNGLHENVDGFWWRPSRQWFKIPNHCSVVVTAAPDAGHASGFRTESDCDRLGASIQRMRGLPDHAGFFPDAGNTGHGTDYPF